MIKSLIIPGYKQKKNPPINYSEIKGGEQFISFVENVPDVYLIKIDNCYISSYGVVMKNWGIVKESIYSMIINNNHYPTFIKKILLGKVKRITGKSAVAHNAFFNNYYHWTAESLPRLFLLKDLAPEITLLIHENVPKYVNEYIDFFNFKNIKYIKDDELAKAQSLILPMHTAKGLHHNAKILTQMTEWLRIKADKSSNNTFEGYENIYIARSHAAYRRILNEPEVLTILDKYNFKTINFEDYSIADQIKLVSQSKNIIAIHGAGLVNIMYMPKGSSVINLAHENHFDSAFYNLSSILNINYIHIQCKAANQDSRGVAHDNFMVDIQNLESHLKNL